MFGLSVLLTLASYRQEVGVFISFSAQAEPLDKELQ